jgi:hypothetical protein
VYILRGDTDTRKRRFVVNVRLGLAGVEFRWVGGLSYLVTCGGVGGMCEIGDDLARGLEKIPRYVCIFGEAGLLYSWI